MANKFNFRNFDAARAKALLADVRERAETAREQAAASVAKVSDFNKGNVEALMAAGKIVVTGAKPLAEEAVSNTRRQLDELTASVKGLKGLTLPEAIKVQREAAKVRVVAMRDDTKAFGQSVAKLAGEAAAPIKGRYAEVLELAKAA